MKRHADFRCAERMARFGAPLVLACIVFLVAGEGLLRSQMTTSIPGLPKALKVPKIPGLPKFKSKVKQKFTMQINVSDGANENSPIPMDLVMVLDKKAVPEVAKLSSKDWFERRVQVERDHPGKIVVASWEWAPGQHVGPISVDVDPEYRAGFLFANYSNTSDHRAVIDVRSPIVVNLQAEDFSVMALK